MKYLKTYEKYQQPSYYWLIPHYEKLMDSLEKIQKFIKDTQLKEKFIPNIKNIIYGSKYEYIYVRVNISGNDNDNMGYRGYEGIEPDIWYKDHGCKYMGRINIDDDELETKIDIKKYNL